MSTGAKVALAVTAPIWIPVTLAIAVLCLPVAIGVTVIDGFKMKDFKKYKVSYMERWTSEALKNTFNEKNLREFLFEIYNKHFKSKLDELCEDFIPKQIAADERQLDLIIKDSTISDKIVELLEPTLVKLNKIQEQLKMFEIFYLTKYIIDPRDIHIKEETDKGKFSDVCLAMWNHDNEETIVAVKVLERNLNYPDLPRNLKLKDIEMLRRLMHQNIVEVYGLCYIPDGDEGNESRLTLVMENCEENLESVVFGNIHLQCGNFRTSAERKNAFMFYVRMATAVCDGLADMHKRGFFHRDLRLSNILVKNNTAKLSNFGYENTDLAATGASVSAFIHVAPELLMLNQYTVSADIFSLGILLWELWYGRRAYSETEVERLFPPQLLDALKKGNRPAFNPFSPDNELKTVIEACWHVDPLKRPEASDVSVRLKSMFTR